jgi:hypothetical protein
MLAKLAIAGVTISLNVIIWWSFYAFCMGMAAHIGWPLLILAYSLVMFLTIKNLGNSLCFYQALAMTIIFAVFLYSKIM